MSIAVFVVMVVVFSGLAIVGYVLFELTPFARHADYYRDPRTGKRRIGSPHLENWAEFEQRTHGKLD